MLTEKLIELMKKEEEILDSLMNTATKKQKALVENKRDELDECTHSEESLLPQLQSYERQRALVMDKIKMENGITENSRKLEFLVEKLSTIVDSSIIDRIKFCHARIKQKVHDVTKLNQQNLFLINQSRKFISDTINAIISTNEKSIFDKKV